MTYERDFRERFIDKMGLVVALSGQERFQKMKELKDEISALPKDAAASVRLAIKARFTPTNGEDGCRSGMDAVKETTNA